MSAERDGHPDEADDASSDRTPDGTTDAAPRPDGAELSPSDAGLDDAEAPPSDARPDAVDAAAPPPDAARPAPDAPVAPAEGCAFVDLPLPTGSVPTGPETYRINAIEVVATSDEKAPEGPVRASNAVAEQTGVMAALIAFDPSGETPLSVRLTAAPGGDVHVRWGDAPGAALDAICPGKCDVCTCASADCRRAETCLQIVGDVPLDAIDPSMEPFEVSANGWSKQPFRAAIARHRRLPGDFPLLGGEDRIRVDTTGDGRLRVTAPSGAALSLAGDPGTLAALDWASARTAWLCARAIAARVGKCAVAASARKPKTPPATRRTADPIPATQPASPPWAPRRPPVVP